MQRGLRTSTAATTRIEDCEMFEKHLDDLVAQGYLKEFIQEGPKEIGGAIELDYEHVMSRLICPENRFLGGGHAIFLQYDYRKNAVAQDSSTYHQMMKFPGSNGIEKI